MSPDENMLERGVIIIGPTSIDKIVRPEQQFFKLGGVTTYAGLTFKRQALDTAIVSNVAPQDGAILRPLIHEGIRVYQGDTQHTTHFINYAHGNQRRQELPLTADSIQYQQIAGVLETGSLLHLGPLYPTDIAQDALRQLQGPELFISLDIQGYVRYRKHTVIHPCVSDLLPDALRAATIIKADRAELDLILQHYAIELPELMERYNLQEVVVTAGSQGGIVRNRQGSGIRYRSVPIRNEVDPTGSGDVFFATYLVHRLFKGCNMQEAANQAAQIAARQIEGAFIPPEQLTLASPELLYMLNQRQHRFVSRPVAI